MYRNLSTKKKMLALACSLSLLAAAGCGADREADDTVIVTEPATGVVIEPDPDLVVTEPATGVMIDPAPAAPADLDPVGTLPPADSIGDGEMSEPGRQFLGTAIAANQHEIEAARRAIERAQNADVRAFAEHVQQDHTQLGEQLRPLVDRAGVTVAPTEPSMPTLEGAEGEAFDSAFIMLMVADHERTVADFERVANDATVSEDVRNVAQQALPALREHLEEAQRLAEQLGAATGN